MVLGIGIDIIEIERIKESIENYGDAFLNKIYTDTELEYCLSKKNKYQHFAARFAAKEAIIKALSSYWTDGVQWKDMEVFNEENGQPIVRLYGKLESLKEKKLDLKITMSHSDHYVTCFALLQQL